MVDLKNSELFRFDFEVVEGNNLGSSAQIRFGETRRTPWADSRGIDALSVIYLLFSIVLYVSNEETEREDCGRRRESSRSGMELLPWDRHMKCSIRSGPVTVG